MPTAPNPVTPEDFAGVAMAMTAAFQTLVICLQNNGALERGEVPEALRVCIETIRGSANPVALRLLHDMRQALLE